MGAGCQGPCHIDWSTRLKCRSNIAPRFGDGPTFEFVSWIAMAEQLGRIHHGKVVDGSPVYSLIRLDSGKHRRSLWKGAGILERVLGSWSGSWGPGASPGILGRVLGYRGESRDPRASPGTLDTRTGTLDTRTGGGVWGVRGSPPGADYPSKV